MKFRVSYSAQKERLAVGNETVEIKPYQVVLWLSIAVRDMLEWDPRTPRFPALLDPGNNHNLSIREDQLVRWAGIQPELLDEQRWLQDKGIKVPLRAAAVWLHADEPYRLTMAEGIAVYPQDGPRLPLLGLRALTQNKLQALIYGDRMQVVIRTPPNGIGRSEFTPDTSAPQRFSPAAQS
jgi:hypothetical protein